MSNDFQTQINLIIENVVPECRKQVQRDIETVLATGAKSYDDWLAVLQEPTTSVDIRTTICWALARLGGERVLPALLVALHDQSPSLRAEAGLSLGKLGNIEAIQPLSKALREDEDAMVRIAAAYGLGILQDKLAVEPLVKTLENQKEEPQVRGQAAEALSYIADKESIKPLITALRDASAEVRSWAIFALGQIGDAQALPELERLAATDEAIVPKWGTIKDEATEAIEAIKNLQHMI